MKYVFYIVTEDGQTIEWRGLTLGEARKMNTMTDDRVPLGVRRYGWAVQS